MKNFPKKVLSVLLVMIFAFGVIPMGAVNATDIAEDTTPYEREVKTQGTGWVFYTTGELVITKDYTPVNPSPWADFARDVLAISISEGVTAIGESEFEGCCSIKTAYIPASVKTIGNDAFKGCESLTLGAPDATVFFGGENFTNWDDIKYYFPEGIVTAHKHAHQTELRNINVYACSSKGTKGDTYCKICNTLITIGDAVTKKAHNTKDVKWTVAKEATCGEDGQLVKYCKLCGEVAETQAIPATGEHDYSVFVKRTDADSDCTKAGTEDEPCMAVFKCANCDATETRNDEETRTHEWVVKNSDPEITEDEWMAEDSAYCANGGVANMVCKYCSQTKQIKKEHVCASGEYVIDYDSTCQKEGRQVQICDNCGEKFNSKTIEKKEHNYVDAYPNCVEDTYPSGITGEDRIVYEVCTYCGDKYEKTDDSGNVVKWVDSKTDEAFTSHQGEAVTAPNYENVTECTDNAVKETKCSICGFVEEETTINALYSSHKYVTANTYDDILALDADDAAYIKVTEVPTCQEEGEAIYYCMNRTLKSETDICTHTVTRSIPKVDCDLVLDEDECVAPTCTRGGYDQYYCKWCGKGERVYKAIVSDACVMVTDPETNETCTENGLTEKVYCSECGKVTTEATIKDALGHVWVKENWNSDNNCEHFHECTRVLSNGKVCGAHSELISYDKKETCTEDGYEGSAECEVCGYKVEPTVLAKTGHNFVDKYDETYHWQECTNCGTVQGKAAHNSNGVIDAVAATCTATGLSEGHKCSVCGYVTEAQKETAKADHSYSGSWVTDGTYHWKSCINCGFVAIKYRNSDHHFTIKYNEYGHYYYCTDCQSNSPVVAHTMSGYKVTTEAKPFKSGVKTDTCTECGYSVTETYKLGFIDSIKWIINYILDAILSFMGA